MILKEYFCWFCQTFITATHVWLQPMNEYSFRMKVGWFFSFFMLISKKKAKWQRHTVENHFFINHESNFFVESDSFQILEDCFLNFCVIHNVTDMTKFKLNLFIITNILPTILLCWSDQPTKPSSPAVQHLPISFI